MNKEKGCSNSHEESESLMTAKLKGCSTCEDGSKEYHSRSSMKVSSTTVAAGFTYSYSSSEDEDVCPTCLEEYTTENPKIVLHCSHHYHLGCIYEWMERSENCPVCGKVMSFDETN
jgi:large subunit ribosomal protein L7Ae